MCLLDQRSTVLLVLRDKAILNASQPQIIAEAIAAYQNSNKKKMTVQIPSPLDTMTIPCITMVGTRPIFLSLKRSALRLRLSRTLKLEQRHYRINKCIEAAEYRSVAFQRFLAFKDLAKEYRQSFIV